LGLRTQRILPRFAVWAEIVAGSHRQPRRRILAERPRRGRVVRRRPARSTTPPVQRNDPSIRHDTKSAGRQALRECPWTLDRHEEMLMTRAAPGERLTPCRESSRDPVFSRVRFAAQLSSTVAVTSATIRRNDPRRVVPTTAWSRAAALLDAKDAPCPNPRFSAPTRQSPRVRRVRAGGAAISHPWPATMRVKIIVT
jgi:hypothetical protein